MRRYETIIIIDPDASEEARSGLIERVNEIIPQHGGFVIELDDWGQRRLAYEIKKKIRGHYTRIDFCGDGTLVDEMERNFRIDDRVLKFMTVLLERDADVDAIKEVMAAREVEKSTVAEEQAAASEQTDATEKDETASQSDESTTSEKE